MPSISENTSAVTTVQPPQSSSAARTRSVRGARRVNHSPATSRISAAGQQPGDLAADLGVEQPRQPGLAAEAAHPAAAGTGVPPVCRRQLGAAGKAAGHLGSARDRRRCPAPPKIRPRPL